jgi:hypothetical protein
MDMGMGKLLKMVLELFVWTYYNPNKQVLRLTVQFPHSWIGSNRI